MAGSPGKLLLCAAEELIEWRGDLSLAGDSVDIWAFTLTGNASFVARCREVLSADERAKADRFVFEQHRTRYIVAHAVLRHLLSRYCRRPPASLDFTSTAAGKPELRPFGPETRPTVRFNLTHSEDRALVGVSEHAELGIDLERQRNDIEALAIGGNYFYGTERDALELADPHTRIELFFRYWVAKEAVLKAQGVGLGLPLDRFRVDFLPGGQLACVTSLDPARLASDWTVKMLPCDPGWSAAAVARGNNWGLRYGAPGL